MRRLTIIGASGHGLVVAEIAKLIGYKEIVFLDDNDNIKLCGEYPVIGNCSCRPSGDVFVAIGNTKVRQELMAQFQFRRQPVLVHPASVVSKDTKIGHGSVIMAGSVINPGAIVGNGVIINTSSSVDHNCIIGDFVHLAVGAHLCGNVKVGNATWIGAGVTIINDINICDNCYIGAGAVVVNNITEPGVYLGIPAKKK